MDNVATGLPLEDRWPGLADLLRHAGGLMLATMFGGVAALRPRLKGGRADATPPRSAAFEDIVLPHLDAAYNLARFLTRDADAADDIVQNAMLRAFRAFDGFRGEEARAWLLAIVRNEVRDWAQARRRQQRRFEAMTSPDQEDDADIPDVLQATPEEHLVGASEAQLVRGIVETLPAPFREVLVLREFEDMSYRQIADFAGIPVGTVMSRLARGREMFAAAWRSKNEGPAR